VTTSVEPPSEPYELATQVSDRLGRHANLDGMWFDAEVEYWRASDGNRLCTFELSDLGRKIVDWVIAGNLLIPQAIFDEMEQMLVDGFGTDEGSFARGFCMELLEGLDAELELRHDSDIDQFRNANRVLSRLMKDDTKMAWALVRSKGQP
jgi:hypothetical protein